MEKHTFTTEGFSDEKYLTINGKIEKKCPKCKNAVERDFMSEHIEYPEIGEENLLALWCDKCNTYLTVPFTIKKITYTVEMEVGDEITIEE
jgi:hypothetical protein